MNWTGARSEKHPDTEHKVSMLNERQQKVIVARVNEDVDLPLLSEEREERMIEKIMDKIEPHVEPALGRLMPEVYLTCIKLALNEELHVKERRKLISKLLRGELAGPLSRELNERVDIRFIPERLEGMLLKVVANKVIDEFVDTTVGGVDDFLKEDCETG